MPQGGKGRRTPGVPAYDGVRALAVTAVLAFHWGAAPAGCSPPCPRARGLDVRDRTMLGCGLARTGPYRYFGQTCPRVMRTCRHWPRLWERAVAADHPDVAFILVGRWETMDRVLHGRWTHVGEPAMNAYLRSQLERAVALAGRRGARVVLATEPFNRRGERPDGGVQVRSDGLHLTPSGVRSWVAPWLVPRLRSAVGTR